MPMLYVIQHGGNFVKEAISPENIVYLACCLTKVANEVESFYFSDGHATDNFTTFYNQEALMELPEIIDWPSVKSIYWGGEENLDRKRKKQAEFLVKDEIPYKALHGIACYNKKAKKRLMLMGL